MKPDASSPPVEHVVLDAERLRAEPGRFDRLLADFAAGYETMFHGDEAESHEAWRARVAGMAAPQPVMRIAVAVQRDGDAERVIGGAASEYYRASGCVLCTYLYVLDRPEHRHRGHARALLKASVLACAPLGPVRAVLAEVEWPPLLPPDRFGPEAVAVARARLRFFEHIGARMLAFDYVQPALGPARQPVPWLRLVLPMPTGGSGEPADESALRSALDRFLPEFHAALAQDCGRPVDAALLAAQRTRVRAAKPLNVGLDAD